MSNAGPDNDYHHQFIEEISKKTHLSRLALFTRLLINLKISPLNCNQVKRKFQEQYEAQQKEEIK